MSVLPQRAPRWARQHGLERSIFPIVQWERYKEHVLADPYVQGTAFCISVVDHRACFVTAAHVLKDTMSIFLVGRRVGRSRGYTARRLTDVVVHPTADMALGFIDVPRDRPWLRPKALAIEPSPCAAGICVGTYGFPRTRVTCAGQHVKMEFQPEIVESTIDTYYPQGRGDQPGPPVYDIRAETGGGASGGPLLRTSTGAVVALLSKGFNGVDYSLFTPIGHLLDFMRQSARDLRVAR